MSRSRDDRTKDFHVAQLQDSAHVLLEEHEKQVLHHVSCVDLVVVRVVPIAVLEMVRQILKAHHAEVWDDLQPLESVSDIDHGEVKAITVGCLVDRKCIVVVVREVLVEIGAWLKIFAVLDELFVFALGAVLCHPLNPPHPQAVDCAFVPLAEVERNSLRKSPQSFGLTRILLLVVRNILTGVLLLDSRCRCARRRNAVRDL